MFNRIAVLALVCGCFFLTLTGCQKANFEPVFNTGDMDTYKVVQETTKEVSFEQPSLNKSKVDTTQSIVEMTFDQKVLNVSEDGSATSTVTIKSIKLYSKGQKGVNNDFDSTRDADKNAPLGKLIGKSYNIMIAADGKASSVDTSAIKGSAKSREAKALISNEAIEKRHSIVAIPADGTAVLAKSKSWTNLGSTPKGALQPKAFEKVYSLKEIDSTVANIEMNAIETNKQIEGFDASSGGLGVMANIFDSSSVYTGKLKYDIENAKIISYTETLETEHVAAEEPKGGDASKGPDVLTMRFINSYSIETVK